MYTRFTNTDIVTRQAQELVTSTWSNNANNLQTYYTSSTQADFTTATSSGQFFVDVYNKPSSASDSEVQFSIGFGHRMGSGSPDFTNDTGSFGNSAARCVYSQFRQLHFNDDTKRFMFGSYRPESIYVININRARYKQRLTLGSLNLHISGSGKGIPNPLYIPHTGGGLGKLHLTDDSVSNGQAGDSNLGPFYNIVSGSNGIISGSNTEQIVINGSGTPYGHLYPEAGLIILNADAFTGSLTPQVTSSMGSSGVVNSSSDKNHQNMFRHISMSAHLIVDTTEEINSQYYFVRAANGQFNYTNNESFVDNDKNIRFETMKLNPKVFITTVGLYNDAFELVAVAKLSQPIAKDFTKESLIRVKLDY